MKVIKAIVGTVFPDNDQKSPDIARLIIAANVIRSLQRAFLRVNSDDYDQKVGPQVAAGDRLVVYLLTIGVLKEAMDTFRTLDSQGWFRKWINTLSIDTYERVAKACDKKDSSSLYTRVVKPLRDEVAFHWKRDEIQAALCRLLKATAQDVFVSYTGKGFNSRYCLADEILVNILSRDRQEDPSGPLCDQSQVVAPQRDACNAVSQTSEMDIKSAIKEIAKFSGDFHELVDICVGSHLKEKGAILEERG